MANTRTTRTGGGRATPARRDTPPKVNGLNLDKVTREGGPEEPYTCILKARPFTFTDPMEIDWQDAARLDPDDVIGTVRFLLGEEEWERFSKIRMPLWKLSMLANDLKAHYRITPEDEGKDDAPEPSSNGTAPR